MGTVEDDLRPELRVAVRVRSEVIPVVGTGSGRERFFVGDGRGGGGYVGGGGALAPWLGGGGRVLLDLL